MKNISVAGLGMYTTLLIGIAQFFNINIPVTEAENFIMAIASLIAFGTWMYGQIRRKDLTLGLFRK